MLHSFPSGCVEGGPHPLLYPVQTQLLRLLQLLATLCEACRLGAAINTMLFTFSPLRLITQAHTLNTQHPPGLSFLTFKRYV